MQPPAIRIATEAERPRALNTLSLAFAADPFMRWMLPSADDYLTHFQPLVDLFAGQAIDQASGFICDGMEGAALWLAAGIKADEDEMGEFMQRALPPEKLEATVAVLEKMEEYHPDDQDCWYLAMIGVDPGHRGKGLGGALMKHMTAQLDANNCLGYLESSNPLNISLYQRHGFEIMGEISVNGSPVMTPMLRPRRDG